MYSDVLEDLMEESEENSEAESCDDDKYGEGEEDRAEVYEERLCLVESQPAPRWAEV